MPALLLLINLAFTPECPIIEGDILTRCGAATQIAPVTPPAGKPWTNATVPFLIDADVAQAATVREAMDYWSRNTGVQFVERTTEPDFVRIIRVEDRCAAHVGQIGGPQFVYLSPSCGYAILIHELGHTLGLWHEQSREDRDRYVDVRPEFFTGEAAEQHRVKLRESADRGAYDYASIMHYGPGSSRFFGESGMETRPRGIRIGLPSEASAADIDGVRRLYGFAVAGTTITTHPPGLTIRIDGAAYRSPQTFAWAPGEVHTIEAPEDVLDGDTAYRFARWSDEGSRLHAVQASPDVTVFTAYMQWRHRLRAETGDAARGSVVNEGADPDGFGVDGTSVRVRAIPLPGFRFYRWVQQPSSRNPLHANPLEIVLRGGAISYTAEFIPEWPTTIATEPPGMQLMVDGRPYVSPVSFLWTPGSEHTIVAEPEKLEFEQRLRRRFLSWSDGGAREHSITAGPNGGTVTASYTNEVKVDIEWARLVPPPLPGSITVDPPSADDFYPLGTILRLKATANPGYRFRSWTGTREYTQPEWTLRVESPMSIGTRFVRPLDLATEDLVDAATLLPGPVAPGQIVSIFGAGMGPETGVVFDASRGRVETELAGTQVLFGGIPAPVLYASDRQVNVVAPYGLAGRTEADVRVQYRGATSAATAVFEIAPVSPGFFSGAGTGRGLAAALNQDGSVNSPQNPAEGGSVIVLFLTGTGPTVPPSTDGEFSPAGRKPAQEIAVYIGWRRAVVEYAGSAPGLVAGVTQINARVPEHLSGEQPVVVEIGGIRSPNIATIAVRQ